MTARGELFIDEDLRDLVEEKINKKLGIKTNDGIWRLDASDYSNYWDEGDIPEGEHKIPILNDGSDEVIGYVYVEVEHYVEDDGHIEFISSRFIEKSIKITDIKDECVKEL